MSFDPSFLALSAVIVFGMVASAEADDSAAPRVRMTTSLGDIVIEMFPDRAPETVENFLAYTKAGHYDGTVFHRVIPGFVIQGGGFTAEMRQKPTQKPVKNESDNGVNNERGTLSMARTSDPHSATSQFFINLVDNASLDHRGSWGYAVFGKVVEGMDVVDQVAKVPTHTHPTGHQNVPREQVVVTKATVEE